MRTLVAIHYSPWSLKARWALDHHGLEYRYEEYVPYLGEPVLRARLGFPRSTVSVPQLFDGKLVIGDSLEIAKHADSMGGGKTLFPRGKLGEVERWNAIADGIAAAGRGVVTSKLLESPKALLESSPPWIPAPLRATVLPVARQAARHVLTKYRAKRERDELVATMRENLARARQQLDGKRYLLGDDLTAADLALACSLQGLRPSSTLCKLGPATTEAWSNEDLARDHEDILAWRDRLIEDHFPKRRQAG